jgi:hypothetical protein
MRFEEGIFLNRNDHKESYKSEGNEQIIEDLMNFCVEYSTNKK